MQGEDSPLIHADEQPYCLDAVADGIVRSFASNHVTLERADAVRLAFEDVLLVRYASKGCGTQSAFLC